MNTYTPDTWVVLEFSKGGRTISRKVFAGFYGGFAGGDSWKLNSGIESVEHDGDWLDFYGYSGSLYHCHKNNYKLSAYQDGLLKYWQDEAGDTVSIKLLSLDEVLKL